MSQIDFQEEPPQIDFQEEPSPGQLLAQTPSPKYRSSFSDILLDAGAGIIHKIAHPFETAHDAIQGVTDLAQAASRKVGLMPEGTPNIPVAPVLSPEQVQYGVQQLWPISQPGPYQQGVQRFLGGLGSAMTSPEMAPALGMGAGALKAFQVVMPMQVPDAVKATVQGIKSNDVPAAVEGGLNTLLSVAPAVHPVYEGFRPILDKVTEAQRPLETAVQEAQQAAPVVQDQVTQIPEAVPQVVPEQQSVASATPKLELSDKQFTDLKHDLAALEQGHRYAQELGTGPTTEEFNKARGAIWMKAVQTGDYDTAQAELSTLKKSLRKPAGQGATEGLSAPVEDGQRQIQPAPPSGGMTPEEQAMEQKRLADLQIEEAPKEGNAIPSDYERYQKLVQQFRSAPVEQKFEIQKQIEELKNKNGVMPPKPLGIQSEPLTESPAKAINFARANSVETRDLERLGINEGANAHAALTSLAAKPELFGPENANLAKFLTDNFEHVLRTVELKPDAGRSENQRSNYDPIPHTIQLALSTDANSIPFKLLEESAHAATWWQFEKARTPTQLKAKENITRLLEQATLNAPEEVQAQIGTAERGLAYRLKSEQEFIAGLFTDPELKQLLKGFKVKGGELVELSGWDAAKNYIRELLGIAPDTAYAKALEQLVEVGAERDTTSIDRARADYELDPVSAPSHVPVLATIHDITFGNKADKFLDKMRGYTYPAHAAVSHNLANHLARYAASAVYGPEGAKSIATDVLGPRYWRTDHKLLGAAIVEDQLRQARRAFQEQADAEADPAKKAVLQDKAESVITTVGNSRIGPPTRAQAESGIKSEQHYQRIWNNPENQEIVQRFKDKVMPIAEQQHVALGGKVLAPSEETGVFTNLRALLGDDSVESRNSMIFGSRRGNLSNPLITGSRFAMERKGTAQSYDFSMRNMIDRMIRGNYEKAALDAYYKVVEGEGFGTLQKQGKDVVTETIKGQPLRLLEIKRRGGGPGQTVVDRLWIRHDLYDEARKATDTDHVPERGVLGLIADVAATIQVTGTVDIASHLVSMVSTISGMPGTKFGPLFDAIKKSVPPVGFADALIRIGYNWTKAIHDQPETQRAIAEYSKEGAGRPLPQHQADLVGRILKALGTPEKLAEAVDLPSHLAKASSKVLRGMDQGGRLAALAMYKEMVRRGMVEDSPLALRETVNNLGQYQSRMMGHFPELFRRIGMSNFVVAGTTMNRNAVRRLLTSPLMRSASPEAWAKMRFVEGVSLAGAILALPFVLNYYFTGNINGRKGTPIGAIDYGKKENEDGSHDYFDPLQLLLLRRALRITGLQSLYRGIEEKSGAKKTGQAMVRDMVQGYLHPYLGPAPRLAYTAATGKDTSGYLLSRNPESMSENVTAAMKNMNPNVAAWIKGKEKGQGKGESTLRALGVSVGLKTSPVPSYQDRLDSETKKQFPGKDFGQLGVGDRRQVVKSVESATPTNDDELAKRAAGMRAYWADYEKQDALKAALPKEQQDWLDKNKLTLPAFKAEFTQGRVKIKGMGDEEKFMAEEVKKGYEDKITMLMETPDFEALTQKEKQRRLGNVLDLARTRARHSLRRRMNEAGAAEATPP